MTSLRIVPLAFVMVAGPQIISAIVLATSERSRPNSFAYVAGATASTVVGTTVFFIIAQAIGLKSGSERGGHAWVDWILVGLLVLIAIRIFLRRADSEPPKWMGRLQGATPQFAFRLGALLFIAMPTDILTMLTVAGFLSSHNESLAGAIPFWVVTALFVGSPLLTLLALGRRAQTSLPKLRDWMNANSWVVSEIVIVFFVVLEINDAISN
jgi:hypothetical protein